MNNTEESRIDSIEFAKNIIKRANILNREREGTISLVETKLHKLLYICDGYLLAAGINFIDENAKAWNYGPVYPRVHTWLEKQPDDVFLKTYDDLDEINFKGSTINELIDAVLNTYGSWTSNQLSDWSHRPGSPWEKALEKGNGVMNSIIDKNDMKKYFKGLLGGK